MLWNGMILDPKSSVSFTSDHISITLKICDVMCSFFDDLKLDDSIVLNSTASIPVAYKFNLRIFKQYCALSFLTGSDFANINTKTTNGLRSLMELSSVRYEVYITANEWTEKLKARRLKVKKVGLMATINVYGARAISSVVGDRLSRASLYLQHPDHCGPASQYENPHFFKLPQSRFPKPEFFCKGTIPISSIQPASASNYVSVFDTLSRYKYLRHAEIDPRVTTLLLPFVNPCLSLWG